MGTLAIRGRLSKGIRSRIMIAGIALAGLLGTTALPARAGIVLSGNSNSYGVSADVTLVPAVGPSVQAIVTPQPVATGVAPPPYSSNVSLASVDVSAGTIPGGALVSFQSGLLEEVATSNVDGSSGPRTTSASSTINALSFGFITTALGGSGIGITSTLLMSSSTVTGDYGSLTATGSLTVEHLSITVNGVAVAGFADFTGSIAANTTVDLGAAFIGASLILNEQILSGDGISSRDLTVNAVDLRLVSTGVAGLGTLDGQVIIEHSYAAQTAAVPEPSSWCLGIIAAVTGLGYRWRRQRVAS
jgi:hypothetical protein